MAAKKKSHKGKVLLLLLVIVVVVILIFRFVVYDRAKEKVTSAIAEKMLEEQVSGDSTGRLADAQNIYESMNDEDKETVSNMIESKVSAETISEVSSYVKNKDTEGLKQYVQQEFTEDEIQQMKDLYEKYKQ